MKNLSFTLLFTLLTVASFAQNGTIRGTITDEIGLGLPGANVIIESLTLGTSSDVNGNFTLVNIPVGEQEITVTFIGYGSIKQTVSVEKGKTATTEITLNPGVMMGGEIFGIRRPLERSSESIKSTKK